MSNKVAKVYLEATSKILTKCLTGVQELAKAHLELIARLDSMRKGMFLRGRDEETQRLVGTLRERNERCLVTRAVAANVDIRVCEDDGGGFMVGVHAPGCDEELARCVPAADVPATLARLLGEVAK